MFSSIPHSHFLLSWLLAIGDIAAVVSYIHNIDIQIRVMETMQLVKQNVLQINWHMFGFCIHDEIMYFILELEGKKECTQIKIRTKEILAQWTIK